jgi:uncharacterized protein (TIGR02996 family)
MALDGFVQTLQEDPEDHISRLVFRDWLSDQNEKALRARGELMAVQEELTRWVPDLERRSLLQLREQELIGENRDAWLGPLSHFDHRFELGMAHLTLTSQQFLDPAFAREAPALFQRGWVRSIRLLGVDRAQMADLVAAPHLAEAVHLDLKGARLDDRAARALATLSAPNRLRELDLSGNRFTNTALHSLGQSSWAKQLTSLGLRGNRLSNDPFDDLLRSFPRLRHLSLQGNTLDEVGRQRWLTWQQGHTAMVREDKLPARLFNSLGMAFARIPAGTFLMGSPPTEPERKLDPPDEDPRHPVTISRPFYLGIVPVTQREYLAVMGENPSAFQSPTLGGPEHPVEQVKWERGREFCRRLSHLPEEASAGHAYRLCSEAEWEYACRAGTTTPFWWGSHASSADANFDGNWPYLGPRGIYRERTSPVGSYAANPFGLYDTHGNVWEWCADWYDDRYYRYGPSIDPPGSDQDGRRTARGGSWLDKGSSCRSACRDFWYGTIYSSSRIGLRIVLTLPGLGVTGGLPAS